MSKQEELAQLHREIDAEFRRKYSGVIAVGYGLRERAGQVTREIAFRVYVRKKQPRSHLTEGEILPTAYKGIAIDVLEEAQFVSGSCADHQKHDRLTGGINVMTYRKMPDGKRKVGTLGFFATINSGADAPKNVSAITNNHVVGSAGEQKGNYVYQPPWIQDATHTLLPAPLDDAEAAALHAPPGTKTAGTPIGKIWFLPPRADHPYTYTGEGSKDYYVDCASVQLAICISSLCHTNCSGFDFSRKIPGLNLKNSDDLIDIDRVKHEDIGTQRALVYKVGASTGRSAGEVIDVFAPVGDGAVHGKNAMKINATSNNCGGQGTLAFSEEGDSGAAVVNGDGKLVGLLFGHDKTDATKSYASHIHPVLDILNVTAITQNHPLHDNKASVETLAEMQFISQGRTNQSFQLRERFLSTSQGQLVEALVERHRPEVVHLVNNNRRVTVAWRRNQGPAFLNRAMNNARDPEELIPWEIEGVTRTALLNAMAAALSEHGSPELRQEVARYRDEVLAHATACDNLHELVDRLSEKQMA
jgi:hypothetical protein